ncbi:MAG: hypothetical protein G01um101420_708 [Parcubacteria group bacterium Gr01-1014_20]|nr:MAG: hypothetical protein G01um101420_708 [Parcubacteria group bacterium Gr01-1014_20]
MGDVHYPNIKECPCCYRRRGRIRSILGMLWWKAGFVVSDPNRRTEMDRLAEDKLARINRGEIPYS